MKLHCPDGTPTVFKAHHNLVFGPGSDSKGVRDWPARHQRVVAYRLKTLRDVRKDSVARVKDGTRAAVHRLRSRDDLSSKRISQSLQTQAYTQDRQLRVPEDSSANTEVAIVFRTSRSGRDDDVVAVQFLEFIPTEFVVADH